MSSWFGGWLPGAAPRACHIDSDCTGGTECCDMIRRVCVKRGSAGAACAKPAAPPAGPAPAWEYVPGQKGFNEHARAVLRAAGLPRSLACDQDGDRWYQHVLKFLVRPESPIQRLLVVWQLGAGKTIGMLRVLDNYFDDPRPKCLVFPEHAVRVNFYVTLGQVPNKFGQRLAERGIVASGSDSETYAQQAEDFLHLWPLPKFNNRYSGLAAPLRAFTYDEIAQGKSLADTFVGWPADAKERRLAGGSGRYCLSEMIVLCDEALWILRHKRTMRTI